MITDNGLHYLHLNSSDNSISFVCVVCSAHMCNQLIFAPCTVIFLLLFQCFIFVINSGYIYIPVGVQSMMILIVSNTNSNIDFKLSFY